MQDPIPSRVESVMQSLQQHAPAQPDPRLADRIAHAVASRKRRLLPLWVGAIAAGFALLLVANVAVVQAWKSRQATVNPLPYSDLQANFSLYAE